MSYENTEGFEGFMEAAERIRRQVDIVREIANFVQLDNRGKYWEGRCPFHGGDQYPTFIVSPRGRIYHCFHCGATGDVIAFAARFRDISWWDAVYWLATLHGIPCPELEALGERRDVQPHALPEKIRLNRAVRTQVFLASLKNPLALFEEMERHFAEIYAGDPSPVATRKERLDQFLAELRAYRRELLAVLAEFQKLPDEESDL